MGSELLEQPTDTSSEQLSYEPRELPRDIARSLQAVVLEITPAGVHTVGMVNPQASLDYDAIIQALNLPRRLVRKRMVTTDEFEAVFRRRYNASEETEALEGWTQIGGRVEERASDIEWEYDEAHTPADRLDTEEGEQPKRVLDRLLRIMVQGAKFKASDIFFIHEGRTGTIKLKKDGVVLDEVIRLECSDYESMVNAALSRGNITSTDMDREFGNSKIHIRIDGKTTEYRLSSIPSVFGKSLCLRLNVNVITEMDKLGFFPSQIARIKRGLERTEGMICIAGPTGSGKSNTMQSMLFHLDDGSIIICQAGNPIEFVVPGWIQVSINDRERTWAATFDQFMRHAPNVITPGEVRTPEEAEQALKGASTGHLLMTTIHATSAAKAISRWQMLEVIPYELAEHTGMIISQRLPRLLCPACRIPDHEHQGEFLAHDKYYDLLHPNKCPNCLGRGYSGRTAIGEVLLVTPRVRQLILSQASSDEIELAAREEGMMTISEAAEVKISQGLTTRKEIKRVLGEMFAHDLTENEYSAMRRAA